MEVIADALSGGHWGGHGIGASIVEAGMAMSESIDYVGKEIDALKDRLGARVDHIADAGMEIAKAINNLAEAVSASSSKTK